MGSSSVILGTIDDVISRFREGGVTEIDGNIIFPSRLIEEPLSLYAERLGINLVVRSDLVSDRKFKDSPNIIPTDKAPDEYFMHCSNVESFAEAMARFKEHGQLPPYFLTVSTQNYQFRVISVPSVEAVLRTGRIQEFKYDLSMMFDEGG